MFGGYWHHQENYGCQFLRILMRRCRCLVHIGINLMRQDISFCTLLSLKFLAQKSGLRITDIVYDSNDSQFIRSFFYERGVPFHEITAELVYEYFTKADLLKMEQSAKELNRKGFGDHMNVTWARD